MLLQTNLSVSVSEIPYHSSNFQDTSNNSQIFNNISRSKNRLLKSISTKLNDEDFIELAPLLPFLVILTILFLLLLAVSFQRWPGLVVGIVAGCLTSLTIYLIMSTITGDIPLYE